MLLKTRLAKLEGRHVARNNITGFEMVAEHEADAHKAAMLEGGHRLVKDVNGFQLWLEPGEQQPCKG